MEGGRVGGWWVCQSPPSVSRLLPFLCLGGPGGGHARPADKNTRTQHIHPRKNPSTTTTARTMAASDARTASSGGAGPSGRGGAGGTFEVGARVLALASFDGEQRECVCAGVLRRVVVLSRVAVCAWVRQSPPQSPRRRRRRRRTRALASVGGEGCRLPPPSTGARRVLPPTHLPSQPTPFSPHT